MKHDAALKRYITNVLKEGYTTQEIGDMVAEILNEEEKKVKKKEEAAALAQLYNEFLEKYYPDFDTDLTGEILIVTLDALEDMPPFKVGKDRLTF